MAASVSLSTDEVASSSTRIGGSFRHGARDRDALALAARELLAALADDRVVAVRAGRAMKSWASATRGGLDSTRLASRRAAP